MGDGQVARISHGAAVFHRRHDSGRRAGVGDLLRVRIGRLLARGQRIRDRHCDRQDRVGGEDRAAVGLTARQLLSAHGVRHGRPDLCARLRDALEHGAHRLADADHSGAGRSRRLRRGRAGRIGLALAVGFGTFQLSASILPANVPNLVMAGAIETTYGLHLSYVPYLVLHAPVLGILKGIALSACILALFRDRPEASGEVEPARPLSAPEKRLAALLVVTLGLWLTDSIHGIAPAWVGLAAACLCLLPKIGFVTGEEFGKDVNHRTAIYVAAILGLAALAGQSGLGTVIGNAMLKVAPLDPSAPFTSFASIVGITTLLNFIVTANGVPALFTPLAQSFATASGLPLLTVLMVQVIGFATPVLPYQASPIVVAMGMGKIPFAAALRLSLLLAAITFLVLMPLN
ncbi:MAG: anion permease [Amaricoccus sp.]